MIKKLKALTSFVGLIAIMTIAVGCATLQGLSTEQQYLAARLEFNTLEKQYLDYYDAATVEDQAIFKAEIDPIFAQAEVVLDDWGVAVKSEISADVHQQQFLDIKNELIDVLAKYMVKE